jgi:DNA invertase Pin-like site-specific DNA recombinase
LTFDFTGRGYIMSKYYGFARCSLGEEKGQDINRQVRELQAAGAEEIITERIHGDAKVKPQLDFLLEHIEPNSTLFVTEVSRLSRSTQQLCEILNTIKDKHLRLVILNSVTIDCRNGEIDAMSMAFLQMAGVFSELELSMIRARVRSGMANAKAKGKQIGRKPITKADLPATFIKYYPSYANGTMNVTELARVCGLSRPTIYKYIHMMV